MEWDKAHFRNRLILLIENEKGIFVCMVPLVIYPENAEQLKTVKAILKALKVQFEPQSTVLPPHILKIAKESIKQYENGETISFEEFKARHFSKKQARQ